MSVQEALTKSRRWKNPGCSGSFKLIDILSQTAYAFAEHYHSNNPGGGSLFAPSINSQSCTQPGASALGFMERVKSFIPDPSNPAHRSALGKVGGAAAIGALLPEGAELLSLPPGLGITINAAGANAVAAAESITGLSAGVSYSAGGAAALGGAGVAAAAGVGFAGTGIVQVIRQSPGMGYVPENGWSTGYWQNFHEMYGF
jgi:hypothetical protein